MYGSVKEFAEAYAAQIKEETLQKDLAFFLPLLKELNVDTSSITPKLLNHFNMTEQELQQTMAAIQRM